MTHRSSRASTCRVSLPKAAIEAYEAVDPGNARLRALAAATVGTGAWQLLWMPPPSVLRRRGPWATQAARRLTKRLIFSSWNVVPDAISVLLSYEAERQMMLTRGSDVRNVREERARLRGLLAIRRGETGAPPAMSTFALVYPCVTLAEIADPLAISRDLRAATDGGTVTADAVLAEARRRIADALAPLTGAHRRKDPRTRGGTPLRRCCWTAADGRAPRRSSGSDRSLPRSRIPGPRREPTRTATTSARGRKMCDSPLKS